MKFIVDGLYLYCLGPAVVNQSETMAIGGIGREGRVQGAAEGGGEVVAMGVRSEGEAMRVGERRKGHLFGVALHH